MIILIFLNYISNFQEQQNAKTEQYSKEMFYVL